MEANAHSYLAKPPRAKLLHNICPTFIWPDAASQQEMDEIEETEEEGGETEVNDAEGEATKVRVNNKKRVRDALKCGRRRGMRWNATGRIYEGWKRQKGKV